MLHHPFRLIATEHIRLAFTHTSRYNHRNRRFPIDATNVKAYLAIYRLQLCLRNRKPYVLSYNAVPMHRPSILCIEETDDDNKQEHLLQ